MALLRVLKEGVELQSIDLGPSAKPEIRVGRSADADIRLDDRAVGREHAVVLINQKGLFIQKKSKFGKLSVNGNETAESPLKPGDVISIAEYLMRVEENVVKGGDVAVAPAVASTDIVADTSLPDAALDLAPVLDGPTGEIKVPAPEANEPEMAMDNISPEPQESLSENTVANAEANGEAIGLEMNSDSAVSNDERTAIMPSTKVVTKLIFKPGEANVEEFVIKKSEISIGRGTNCDVVITDSKSSRKHLIIRRVGMNFVAQDLGSANGTHVNGVKITQQELAGDDVLKIGETEFTFKAVSQEYVEQEQQGFMPVPEEEAQPMLDQQPLPQMDLVQPMQQQPEMQAPMPTAFDPNALMSNSSLSGGAQIGGAIPGMGAPGPKKKESLVDIFKRQPKGRKLIIVALLGMLALFVLNDEEANKSKQAKPKAPIEKGDANFNALAPEKKQFVVNTYQLALEHYKNRQYEQAILQADRILEILPGGYKDTKDIKAYAQKSIEIQKANEEEKRRKELEEKLRAEVAELVARAQQLVDQGKDAEAKEVFAQVLEKDPDNPTILRLRQQMEEKDQRKKAEEDEARNREQQRKQMEAVLREGRNLLKAGKFYEAIEHVQDTQVFGNDEKLLKEAKALIAEAYQQLKERAAPHLKAANDAMINGDYPGARDAFYKALKADPRNAEARKGLAKIRDVLHDRAKKIYTDAIILESVSDYRSAQMKYKECLDIAMQDDIYHGRCARKHKRFELLERGTASSSAPVPLSPTDNSHHGGEADPQMPKLPSQPPSVGETP